MVKSPPKPQLSWREIDALLERALELDDPERKAFLDGLDPSIRVRIADALTGEAADLVDTLVRVSIDNSGFVPSETVLAPKMVGPWRLIRELGAGGMAQVFEARRDDADFEQRAAVKVLWPFRSDDRFQERFVQERRILAGLNHPGIAGFLDGGVLPDNRPWFAMEYVEGVRIDAYCHGLDIDERLAVFQQVCEAVAFAHGRLVVHRDIKPANILVDEAGRARLLDFGIAKLMDAAEDSAVTRTGGSMLTLQYASPEQVTRAPLTVASDVYQLGMLLYQLVAERLPYELEGQSLKQAVETISSEEPSPPSQYAAGVGADLDAIVLCALRKEPSQRYSSVSALAQDVRQYREGRPVTARPQSGWYVFRRFVRRNAPLVTAAAMVVLALAVATVVSLSMARRASLEAERSATALRVLTSVFDQADPFGQPGPDITLGDALVDRFDLIGKQVDHDPVLGVQVFNHLGSIFTDLGMHDQAQRAYRVAMAKADASKTVHANDRLASLAGMAQALNDQGRFQETLEFVASLNLGAPASTADARFHAEILLAQAIAQLRTNLYEAATGPLEQANALTKDYALTDPVWNYQFHQVAAESARYAGDFIVAEQHAREAVALAAEAGDRGAEAILLQNLAVYLGRQGRFAEAEPFFLEAMAIVDEHAPGHPISLEFAVNYAGWLYRTDRMDASVILLRDTLSDLTGTPDRHLWAFANRDLAFYAFATGDMALSVRSHLQFMSAVPELYGEDTRDAASAGVVFARHLSLGGLHRASLEAIERAFEAHPRLGSFDLAAYRAELRIDAGLADVAVRDYRPADNPEDPNATLLDLKFACIRRDYNALEAQVAQIDPAKLGESHLDGRLLAWRALMAAALARRDGADPLPELHSAFETLTRTPRLTSLEEWRLMREIVALHETIAALPPAIESAWNGIQAQRTVTREILLSEGPVVEVSNPTQGSPAQVLYDPSPLACLSPEIADSVRGHPSE